MKMNIENIPAYEIAYIRRVGSYGVDNVQTMEKLKEWAKVNNLLKEQSIILGIAYDNAKTTNPENCRYDACIVVSDDNCFNNDYINYGNVAGGDYAVFEISHTAEGVKKAWSDIFSELINRGYTFDESRPILERYVFEMVNNQYCEICVPIKS